MKPQILYAMLMTISMGLLMACGSAETPARETAASISAPATPTAKAVPAAPAAQAAQGGPQVIGSLQNPNFKEGTNDQNRGDKSGTVALKSSFISGYRYPVWVLILTTGEANHGGVASRHRLSSRER